MTTRIAQLSDTHFLADGESPEGGFAYDTSEAFDAVVQSLGDETFDLVTVTGDVADHGEPSQYQVAAAALERLGRAVNVCPGNHDQDATFTAGIGRPGIATNRVVRIDNWCHLFVDSNAGVMEPGAGGLPVDPDDYEDRLSRNGALGEREATFIREQAAVSDADHLFVWVHHPPEPTVPLSADDDYAAEWQALLPDLPTLRGIGAGHTHVPGEYELGGIPVFMAPSLKNNFDLEARTLLPPGYRTYSFEPDGTVASDVRLLDDPRWPRSPYGRAVHSLMMGELDWAQFRAIVERKQAAG